MRRRPLLLLLPATLLGAPARATEIGAALADGRHVLLMRHAYAPGVGDPPGFRRGDCATQRNLDAAGREQARAIGRWLRAQGVARAQVYSSPWCRCLDTARLLGFGAVTVEESLASFFADYAQADAQTRALQAFVARLLSTPSHRAPVLVTHQVNISRYAGGGLGSGDMVLVRVDAQGRPLAHTRHAAPSPG